MESQKQFVVCGYKFTTPEKNETYDSFTLTYWTEDKASIEAEKFRKNGWECDVMPIDEYVKLN
jgi:hypothetical protein